MNSALFIVACITVSVTVLVDSVEVSSSNPEECMPDGFAASYDARNIGEILGRNEGTGAATLAMLCQVQNSARDGGISIELVAPYEPAGVLAISGRIDSSLHSANIVCKVADNNIYNRPEKIGYFAIINMTYQCPRFNLSITLIGINNAPVALSSRRAPFRHAAPDVPCSNENQASLSDFEDLGEACDLHNKTVGRFMFGKDGRVFCSRCCAFHVWNQDSGRCIQCPTRTEPHVFTRCYPSEPSIAPTMTPPNTKFVTVATSRAPVRSPPLTKDPCHAVDVMVPKNLRIVRQSQYYVIAASDPLPHDNKCWTDIKYEFHLVRGKYTTAIAEPKTSFVIPIAGILYKIRVRARTLSDVSKWSEALLFQALPGDKSGKCDPSLRRTGDGNNITVSFPRNCEWSPFNDKFALGIKVRYRPTSSTYPYETMEMPRTQNDSLTFRLQRNGLFILEACVFYESGDGQWMKVDEIALMQGSFASTVDENMVLTIATAITIFYVF